MSFKKLLMTLVLLVALFALTPAAKAQYTRDVTIHVAGPHGEYWGELFEVGARWATRTVSFHTTGTGNGGLQLRFVAVPRSKNYFVRVTSKQDWQTWQTGAEYVDYWWWTYNFKQTISMWQ